ncbi:hypothetical protein BDB01DRAFT_776871 [Pilobolus umbonatus]|nr:hypothetical protein BDB01DRAFT_776871 [Pilobolus umbonatus]
MLFPLIRKQFSNVTYNVIRSASTEVKRRAWNESETTKLLKLVKKYGRDWDELAHHFDDRSKKSIRSRYFYLASKFTDAELNATVKAEVKRKWSKVEDRLLSELVAKHGKKWTHISTFMKDRSNADVFQRYQVLKYVEEWTDEMTEELFRLKDEYPNDWNLISDKIGTMSPEHCKRRWHYIQSTPDVVDDSPKNLTDEQIVQLEKAVHRFGLADCNSIKEATGLHHINSEELKEYYMTEIDPSLDRSEWTEDEIKQLVNLYHELEGDMKLVRSISFKNRRLSDMHNQYQLYKNIAEINKRH